MIRCRLDDILKEYRWVINSSYHLCCYGFIFAAVPSSDTWENEKRFLKQSGISVLHRSGDKDLPLFQLKNDTGCIVYNINDYDIAGFRYGTIAQVNQQIGKVVWIGRLDKNEASVVVGIQVVSG